MELKNIVPEHTAVRTALWRALHIQIDPKPHVFTDETGPMLVAEDGWQNRQDMNPDFSKSMRASIVGRARFVEDLVEDQFKNNNVRQYVILGAGLDTFAQRRPELSTQMNIFEIDQPGPQKWKQKRLMEIGLKSPVGLHFVPVDFEAQEDWWEKLLSSGFDMNKPAVFVSTGVSMYLTKETNSATFKKIAKMVSGSTFVTTFMLALDLLEPKEKSIMEYVMNKAKGSGTPFVSLFSPDEIIIMAKNAGFKNAEYVSANFIYQKYFANRTDGLQAGNAEAFCIAST